ncbi:hypothetical protein OUZ56_018464 [Daphnia magna]|uniref:Uncharacterized protein n=1 Tax=Daphnia magna TaxID=35525 RepID=A0ABQ9Z8X8_9CRUS|nr:hypothetical protein OUZ56_018464 [Daphnia magna]
MEDLNFFPWCEVGGGNLVEVRDKVSGKTPSSGRKRNFPLIGVPRYSTHASCYMGKRIILKYWITPDMCYIRCPYPRLSHAHLARVKTPFLDRGDPIPGVGTVCLLVIWSQAPNGFSTNSAKRLRRQAFVNDQKDTLPGVELQP